MADSYSMVVGGTVRMITAELAQKMVEEYYSLDKGIMIAACQGRREYICKYILPPDVQKEYELNGYTITEDWIPCDILRLQPVSKIKW